MILYKDPKVKYPKNITLFKGMFSYQMAWIMYDKKQEYILLAIDYFNIFDFVNEMIHDGHSITIKP